jgi:membrane fusion protein, multidrug efflux system
MIRLLISIGLTLVVLNACSKKTEPPLATKSTAQVMAAPTLALDPQDIAVMALSVLQSTAEATGTLKAVRQVVIKTKTAGEVTELMLLEGQSVKKGQTVARIDEQESQLRLRERQAQQQSSQAQLELANRTFDNQKQLFQKGFISQAALDSSQTQLNVARAALEQASASVAIAKKGVLDNRLIAPINGIVAERFAQKNEKVGLDARVMLIVDDTSLELEALLQVADAAKLKPGNLVTVKPEGADVSTPGKITRINPATATGTRFVPIHIAIDNSQGRLKQGQFASARVVTSEKNNVISLAPEALREANGRNFVYAVSSDNKIVEQAVQVGIRGITSNNRDAVEIVKGLEVGTQVIVANLGPLRPGSAVEMRTAAKK